MSLLRGRRPGQPADTLGTMWSSRLGVVVVAAVLGLVFAATVAYAASRLVSQPIGLTSEPADLGRSLAPGPASGTTRSTPAKTTSTPNKPTTPSATTTQRPPAATTPAITDADDGAGSGAPPRGDGDHDGDDD